MRKSTHHPYKAYSHASHTVAKTRQVVMLYDGVIRFLSQAKEAMEKDEIERRYNTLTRASDIIAGLQACLDFEAGQETAQTLFDFYSSIELRIMQLHRTKDMDACAQIIADMKEMRQVWDGIDKNTTASPAAQTPPSDPLAPTVVSA